jgi:hypothetical protein
MRVFVDRVVSIHFKQVVYVVLGGVLLHGSREPLNPLTRERF